MKFIHTHKKAILGCVFALIIQFLNAQNTPLQIIIKVTDAAENFYTQEEQGLKDIIVDIEISDSGDYFDNSTDENGITTIELTENKADVKSSTFTITIYDESKEYKTTVYTKKYSDLFVEERKTMILKMQKTNSIADLEPITIYKQATLLQYGKVNLGDILHYLEPSIYHVPQTIADLTDHIAPTTMKGLSTDQFLLLINGKRVSQSALLNVNGSVGRGYASFDLNAIPLAAIDEVEVYRAGASARFGSDAIAGAINVILKNNTEGKLLFSFHVLQSSTLNEQISDKEGLFNFDGEGDAAKYSGYLGIPLNIAKRKGQISFAGEYTYYGAINRSNPIEGGIYESSTDEGGRSPEDIAQIEAENFFENFNERFGLSNNRLMRVGKAQTEDYNLFINADLALSDNVEWYALGNFSRRAGLSSGFARLPRQTQRIASSVVYPYGFLPNIATDINNQSLTSGLKIDSEDNTWNVDISQTFSKNRIDISVLNSNNATLGAFSPTTFDVGGLQYNQAITNIDFDRKVGDMLNLEIGGDYRKENYKIVAGEAASYIGLDSIDNKDPGAQVFPGFQPTINSADATDNINIVDATRNNMGIYALLNFKWKDKQGIDKYFLTPGLRFEKYSDIPIDAKKNWIFKLAGRININENFAIRASYDEGFRAPSLHQFYFTSTSTQIQGQGTVQDVAQVLTFNNQSPIAALTNIAALTPEYSTNLNGGFSFSILKGQLSGFVDVYNINIKDRIIFSSSVPAAAIKEQLPPTTESLIAPEITETQFFLNAAETQTVGSDFLFRWKPSEKFKINFGGNVNILQEVKENDGKKIDLPQTLIGLETTILDVEDISRLEAIQPKTKFILNVRYEQNMNDEDKMGWFAGVKATRFGKVTYISNDGYQQDFAPKIIGDVEVGLQFESLDITIGINNFLNTYPDRQNIDSPEYQEGRFPYSRRTRQFLETGGIAYFSISYDLN